MENRPFVMSQKGEKRHDKLVTEEHTITYNKRGHKFQNKSIKSAWLTKCVYKVYKPINYGGFNLYFIFYW